MDYLQNVFVDKALAAVCASALLKYGVYYVLHKKRPEDLVKVANVSSLVLYPVKSCAGVEVSEAICTPMGLKYGPFSDRHWMVATAERRFLTQRQIPKLALIKPSFHDDVMYLDAPDMPTVKITTATPPNADILKADCWGDVIECYDCGQQVSDWLSKFLEMSGLRLLHTASNLMKRQVINSKKKFTELARSNDWIAMSDFSEYMLTSEDSLIDLNSRLKKPLTQATFRANIIVEGNKAYDEDNWQQLYIGDVKLVKIKECTRCKLTLVDPKTAVVSPEEEPLKTLRAFRLIKPEYGQSPCFGVCLNLDLPGTIRVGDSLEALVKS